MLPDIKHKIKIKLTDNNVQESDVVYVLVQIRKIMEISNGIKEYPTLFFYCNWIVHSKLDRENYFIKDLMSKIRKINIQDGMVADTMFGILSFGLFRRDFNKFIKNEIDADYVPNLEFLKKFEFELKKVITDISVHIKVNENKCELFFNSDGNLELNGWEPKHIQVGLINN